MENYLKHILAIGILICTYSVSFAQSEPSAMMNIESTEKGILIPRMTTTQRTTINNPAKGLLVFDNTTSSFWFYEGSTWTELGGDAASSSVWSQNGTDIYYNDGKMGLGTDSPDERLTIAGSGNINLQNNNTHTILNAFDGSGGNAAFFQIDPHAGNNTSGSVVRFFRSVNSTANQAVNIYSGNNSLDINHSLSSKSNSFLSAITGDVGIGTIDPQSKLHLKGNAGVLSLEGDTHAYLQFYPDGYDAGRKAWFGFGSSGNNDLFVTNEYTDGGLNFRTNGVSNRMYINEDGNIGIGTASPQARLNILSTSDVNQESGGFLILGATSALNIGIDNNEIQARNNGAASTLNINIEGGDTQINTSAGKVVIGNIPSNSRPGDYKLYVENGILSERVRVALESSDRWADDAFDKTPSLKRIEKHIQKRSHLLGVPSAKELVETGIDVAEMDATLLRQIEWLWMSLIEKDKENKEQNEKIESLEKRLEKLEK